jgi:hypothetical protein
LQAFVAQIRYGIPFHASSSYDAPKTLNVAESALTSSA